MSKGVVSGEAYLVVWIRAYTGDGPVPRIEPGGGWVGVAGMTVEGERLHANPLRHALRLGIGLTLSSSFK
jgi:hypothetical protein